MWVSGPVQSNGVIPNWPTPTNGLWIDMALIGVIGVLFDPSFVSGRSVSADQHTVDASGTLGRSDWRYAGRQRNVMYDYWMRKP